MRPTKTENLVIAFLLVLISSQFVTAIGLGTFEKELQYTPGQVATIKYFVIKEEGAQISVNFDFTGDLEPYVSFSFDNYWYSTRVDKLDVYFQREVDLSSVGSATLTFNTKYDIEYGWDFGYVEVSTNNGSSWAQLSGTSTTTYRDGSAYVGVPGAPAYTGTVSGWTLETMNLTPYVGSSILLRFRFVTDDYYTENGWFVDDISISEIGFSDDVESGRNNWSTSGWLHNVWFMNDSSKAVPLTLSFNLPSDFEDTLLLEKLTVTEVTGVDGGYNPGQGAVSNIISILPPLLEISPPAPEPDDEGEGGDGNVQHYTYFKGVVDYFIEGILPDIVRNLKISRKDSIVRHIQLKITSFVKEAKLRITSLDEKPEFIKQDLPDVYRYFEISTTKIYNSMIESAVLQVAVSKEWVKQQGIGPEDVVVTRFAFGKWSDMHTTLVDEDKNYYFLDATLPGFSVFAVRVRYPMEPEPLIEPEPTSKPNLSQVRPVIIVTGNESREKVVDDFIEQVRQKSNATNEEAEEFFRPLEEKPAPGRPLWLKIVTLAIAVLAAFAGIVAIVFKRRKKRRGKQDQPGRDVDIKTCRRGPGKRSLQSQRAQNHRRKRRNLLTKTGVSGTSNNEKD